MNKKTSRRTRHRLYTSAMLLLVIVGIVFFDLSAGVLENKFDWHADFSRSAVFTLSEDTRKLLARLENDVFLYGVYANDARDVTVEQMLKTYDRASERVHSRIVDPVDDVDALLPFTLDGTVVSSGSIVVSDAAKHDFQVLDYYDFYLQGSSGITGVQGEQSISSAIWHLDKSRSWRVIFMNAHTAMTIASVPAFATHLTAAGYALFQSTDPFSAGFASMLNPEKDLLVFLSPNADLEDEEANQIIEYVRRGGRVLAFMDCAQSVDNSQGISLLYDDFPNFDRLFAEAGMHLNRELVLLPEAQATLGSITRFGARAVANGWLDSAIGAEGVVMSECAVVEIRDADAAQPLIMSPDTSYTKQIAPGMDTLDQAAGDIMGARCVGASGMIGEGRVALIGTSSVVLDYFGEAADRRFGMKLTGALLSDAQNPVILPVFIGAGTLKIATYSQQIILIILTTGVLPFAVLALGAIHIRRRKRRSGRVQHG